MLWNSGLLNFQENRVTLRTLYLFNNRRWIQQIWKFIKSHRTIWTHFYIMSFIFSYHRPNAVLQLRKEGRYLIFFSFCKKIGGKSREMLHWPQVQEFVQWIIVLGTSLMHSRLKIFAYSLEFLLLRPWLLISMCMRFYQLSSNILYLSLSIWWYKIE